ncbi:MAG: right-handed parallel beta-helix repeat-containing protein [Gammaproteobacteria bacterium]|nr:right-handed parallel beta-helix repeat-containing protein [Gammaproteobacteria bacterium]
MLAPSRLVLFAIAIMVFSTAALGKTYYLHPGKGDDGNAGTSKKSPWKTMGRVNKLRLKPGDKILLAAGKQFWGSMVLRNVNGKADNPVVISTFKADDSTQESHATINAKGRTVGLHIINSNYLHVEKLIIDANGGKVSDWQRRMHEKQVNNGTRDKTMMRVGVIVEADKPGTYQGVTLDNLVVQNIFYNNPGFQRSAEETRTPNGTGEYGWGIRFLAFKKGIIKDTKVINTLVSNVAHTGIKFGTRSGTIDGVKLENNRILRTGGPGLQFGGVTNAHVTDNVVYKSGSDDDGRKWGRGSGMWTWGSKNFVIEFNAFIQANGPADSAGFHVDFNCRNIVFQYNLSAKNAGGFIEILGNNHNSAYRYNISVNDGYRIKGENGDYQEGKTFWLSGFVGRDREPNGPYNSYIYNNTIYVDESVKPKVAIAKTTQGLLVANNIFHVVGNARLVKGDQYRQEKDGTPTEVPRTIFKNNLFLHQSSWPARVLVQDEAPIYGDAEFSKPGGIKLEDYIPANLALVQDKGIEIPMIPGDDNGLITGLKVKHGIMGNPITGKPDMGAIEIKLPVENK